MAELSKRKSSPFSPLPPVQSSTISQYSDVGQRGFSRKLHEMVKQQKEIESTQSQMVRKEKRELKNWKQLTPAQLSKLTRMQQSRYMCYEPVDKEIIGRQMESLQRVRARRLLEKEKTQESFPSLRCMIELEENSELIGQLKAAEARYRINSIQKSYEDARLCELQHLISSQSTAQEAVRLQSFIPPSSIIVDVPNYLTKSQRKRCEELLDDDLGLTINRTF